VGKRRLTLVFVDSSVLFSAVNSPTGGSAKLFTVENLKLVASPIILTEVERNVRKKLLEDHLKRFFLLAEQLTIIDQRPNELLIRRAKKVIAEKDAVILAEAKQSKAEVVVTLDKKHFLIPKVAKFLGKQKVFTPKILLAITLKI